MLLMIRISLARVVSQSPKQPDWLLTFRRSSDMCKRSADLWLTWNVLGAWEMRARYVMDSEKSPYCVGTNGTMSASSIASETQLELTRDDYAFLFVGQ
jgi:hypothetical protein